MKTYSPRVPMAPDAEFDKAVQHLLKGRIVAFPTETVYGMGADAENTRAIGRIFKFKRRPANHPLIVHVAPGADPAYWAAGISSHARTLMDVFWPGPLTLILPRAAHVPAEVSGGLDTIGLRCPSHPVAQKLLRRFAEAKGGQGGLAAPSANRFGHVSPTTAEHVRAEFPELLGSWMLVLDGGPSTVGIESTIVDVSRPDAPPMLLRPGHLGADQLSAVLGITVVPPDADAPQVSGSLKAHYATRTPLQLVEVDALPGLIPGLAQEVAQGARIVLLGFEPRTELFDTGIAYSPCSSAPLAYARELYANLRRLDEHEFDRILVEQPPRTPDWQGVNDRLQRAAAAFEPPGPAARKR